MVFAETQYKSWAVCHKQNLSMRFKFIRKQCLHCLRLCGPWWILILVCSLCTWRGACTGAPSSPASSTPPTPACTPAMAGRRCLTSTSRSSFRWEIYKEAGNHRRAWTTWCGWPPRRGRCPQLPSRWSSTSLSLSRLDMRGTGARCLLPGPWWGDLIDLKPLKGGGCGR